MQSSTATQFNAVASVAFLIAVLGGVWRGVGSCGGYAWHDHAMLAALSAAALSLLVYRATQAPSLKRRAILAAAVFAAFHATRALAAPFYPSFPGLNDYLQQVGLALVAGPC